MNDTRDTGSGPAWPRRAVLGALGAAPVAVGAVLSGAGSALLPGAGPVDVEASAGASSDDDRIPPDARPGGAYDRYVAELAAQDRFSGVVLLARRGRTVLSRSHGMADRERGIRNREDTAFNLSSASQPFLPVAVLQMVQDGEVALSDPVGTYLTGLDPAIAERVTIHHLLTVTSGMDAPDPDVRRIFHSREEVHDWYEQWTRQATLPGVPGGGNEAHQSGGAVGLVMAAQIVEAVSGMAFWDYMQEHVFGRAGMTRSGFFTRDQWLADEHIAHPYMRQPEGGRVDAVRNLDKDSMSQQGPHENPGRDYIGHAAGKGFTTAPDLVRFADALGAGTVLDRPYVDLWAGAKHPSGGDRPGAPGFGAYAGPVHIRSGEWVFNRGGATGGVAASWTLYLDTGWVGVVLSNYDDIPLQEILARQAQAITGQPADPPGGG